MAKAILAADIGTSSLKAAYIDFDGRLLAFYRSVYDPALCRAGAGGRAPGAAPDRDVPAEAWEHAFALAVKELHAASPDRVAEALCVSGNGPTLVPVTPGGEALPPLYWYGGRIAKESAPSFFLPYAAWFRENFPGDYARARYFVSSHEWLAARLGAETLTVIPQEGYKPFYWDDEQCGLFGLPGDKFPPFVEMGAVMGQVSPEAAARLGSARFLKSGTPVIAGGPDFTSALIGTGTLSPGKVCDRAGSSEGINVCAESRAFNPAELREAGLRVLPHAMEGLWNIGAVIPCSGRLFEWYRTRTGQEYVSYEELLARLIPSVNNSAALFDAELSGKKIPPPSVSFADSGASAYAFTDRFSFGRAVLCAMSFAVRSAAETLAEAGFPVKEMTVSGGQGRNPRWNQLKADMTGVCLKVPEICDGELAGNAALAAAALGAASGIREAAARMIRVKEVYEPRDRAFWEERYADWKEASEQA